MPVYGIRQAGSNTSDSSKNLTALVQGDQFTLFDGTETAASGLASVAFTLGYLQNDGRSMSFNASSIPVGCTVDIQCAGEDVDGSYFTVNTLTPDASGNAAYGDLGSSPYWRGKLSAYASGTMPKLTVKL